ncbi:Associate of Myc 1 protein [Dioscorea alata]|uniref:Associate of Myc 1 protein n=1 Tax=Dioscorea alata TaxID=55571 RepID=A0ACB7ULG2_DIOAL|nr:Associate of Myc 1 protein [Dioscorea alata]
MEKEAKKEAFRKYLESSGVLDALTKVLVALYEESDKPNSAIEFSGALNEGNKSGSVFNFIQQKLGGPSISDYEKLQAEKSDLQLKYDELLAHHRETCRRLEELRNTLPMAICKESVDRETTKDEMP